MEEKLKFVLEYVEQEWSMSELCERYGIARETGYVWLRRYQAVGWEGLREEEPSGAKVSEPDSGGDRGEGAGFAGGAHQLGAAEAEASAGTG
jgi:transposase-like protein